MIKKLETLKDLIQEHKEIALERFKEGSETPIIIGYSGTKRIVFPLFFRNDQEKEQVLQMVTISFIALDVKRYTFDSQGYSLKYDKDVDGQDEYNKLKASGKSIKDHPNHIEVLMCGAVSRSENIMQTFEIVIDGDKKSLKEMTDLSSGSGRFMELLGPSDVAPTLKKEIIQHFNSLLKHLPIKVDNIIQ
jgi:hypothetical protein